MDYKVLATSQGEAPTTNSSGRGYKVLATSRDTNEPTQTIDDTVGLGDILMDLTHTSGSTNADGSRDFFGGDDSIERLAQGVKTASGFDGRIKPEYRSELSEPDTRGGRVRQVIGEVGKGLGDLLNSGMAGMDTTVADLINLVDTDNSVADHYRKLGTDRLSANYNPDGAAAAVGQTIGGMAVEAPIGGKAVDLLLSTGKIAGKTYRGLANRKVKQSEALTKTTKEANADFNVANNIPKPKVQVTRSNAAPKTPGLSFVSDTIGKLSPAASKVLDKYWAKLLAPVSKRAAMEEQGNFINELIMSGVSKGRANNIYDEVVKQASTKGKTAIDALFKPISPKATALSAIGLNQGNN